MNTEPHTVEFSSAFGGKTKVLALGDFGYIACPSWKCGMAPFQNNVTWSSAPRVYIEKDYIGITNELIDRRFRRKFKYENYFNLDELLSDLIPYMENILLNHNGNCKRRREMKSIIRIKMKNLQMRMPHS